MNIQFLGVGSAFASLDYLQSNMLLSGDNGTRMLIDCGTDIRHALSDYGVTNGNVGSKIDSVFISHLHADHVGGLEWLAICTYFNPKAKRPILYGEANLLDELWHNSLKGGLEVIDTGLCRLEDYFDCRPLHVGETFHFRGINLTMHRMTHIQSNSCSRYSYALLAEDPGKGVFFLTTDTRFAPELIRELAPQVDLIFHDCETTVSRTGVHAHYEELLSLPPEIRAKIWLYHYSASPCQDPAADGFLGFVQRGQSFQFDS